MEFEQSEKHVNWSTARKEAARDNAVRLGDLEKFFVGSPLFPFVVTVGAFAGLGLAVGTIERMF